ncbi:TonB-dependent receptor [Sphingomonas cannabina]|uniref:TonB-dependent receptor n=1 Tax=Sphingomonas cannabina TaxID=2899123 RepID=UPI001F165A33|nr:TonB-dependent receptor [Sphingomonas cannabina]UIJ44064.1 TonB-dependent receptor [Sphingomonas cannabina]
MKKFELLAASALTLVAATPAFAQDTAATQAPPAAATQTADEDQGGVADIVITAQRQSERLQDVPIAVSAFTAENLQQQQIVNPTALQQTLPNITYTKTNFTSSSFTIRGIGDLCVGVTCDSATAIHVNDMPLLGSRLFESEFYDLERVEVLRGPQGTLFGRNATSGVVNFITAKPDLSGIHAAGEFEYGNYDSKQAKAMLNVPLASTLGVRVAGMWLNRDGYTKNLHTGNRIDGRDLWSVRGTISWEPDPNTRLDLIGYYFHEKDDRSRIQKQLCHRDPTGVLGCLPDRLANETTNGNSLLNTIFTSTEVINLNFGAAAGLFRPLSTGSLYNPNDAYAGVVNPRGMRTVDIDFEPTYFAKEQQYTAKFFHDFGSVSLNMTGGYMENEVRSRTDYNLAVSSFSTSALQALELYASNPSPYQPLFQAIRNTLIPNGPTGGLCQSAPDPNNLGVFGGASIGCYPTSLDFDESSQKVKQYSAEAHIDSHFDGMFNFLLGGIYFDSKTYNNSYYVNSFGLDYAAAILGAGQTIGQRAAGNVTYPAVYRASPFFRNNTDFFHLKSWGVFGETYFEFNDKVKLTLGLRYNHDEKYVRARSTLLSDAIGQGVFIPYGSDSFTDAVNYANLDFDANTPGAQDFAINKVKFNRLTGRAVLDYRITPDNLLYASYSRGYKSGGINPPLSPSFAVPITFDPEKVDAFEIGSKNTFGNGKLRLNVTGFYYKYNSLQLSRIVSRTAVNDNVNADIYGVEAEAIISPVRKFVVNANFSYLHSKVSSDKFIADPRDPSGGRSDAVIIKDISNAANCAILSNTGSAVAVNTFVTAVNSAIGLRGPTAVPGTNTTGAFSVCSALQAAAANPSAPLRALFGVPTGALPFTMLGSGVDVNIRGNKLPGAPTYKASVGAQYTIDFANGMSLVPRADLNFTGNSYASVFNRQMDRLPAYEVINAQITLNGADDRWYLRGFVQNLTNNNAVTGQYTGDQASGLYTNVFTIEPRRYGIAAGFRF